MCYINILQSAWLTNYIHRANSIRHCRSKSHIIQSTGYVHSRYFLKIFDICCQRKKVQAVENVVLDSCNNNFIKQNVFRGKKWYDHDWALLRLYGEDDIPSRTYESKEMGFDDVDHSSNDALTSLVSDRFVLFFSYNFIYSFLNDLLCWKIKRQKW